MTAKNEQILANLIASKANKDPDLKVLTFVNIDKKGEIHEQTRNYQTLWREGQNIAGAMKKAGMKKGARFAILTQNHPEFVDAMIASSILGTVYVPIDPRTRGDKLVHMLSYVDCQGVICSNYALSNLREILKRTPAIKWVWTIDDGSGEPELPPLSVDTADVTITRLRDVLPQNQVELPVAVTDPNDVMQMLYTSGTTGDPKAIEASYLRYYSVATLGSVIGLEVNDRPYTGLPLSHANAQLITLGNILYMGLEGVISRHFTKSRLWDICRRYGCTTFNLLGGMTTAIYSETIKESDKNNPVRYVFSAGMPAPIWDGFRERFDVEIFEFYGAAEGGLCFNPPGVGPVGSIGKPPSSLEVDIVNEMGESCSFEERGEIVFRNNDGSAPVVSYYKNELASAKKTAGGWLHMGDLGHMDKDGWLYFDCRKDSSIRRNGDFISAAYVEKIIAEAPEVDDVFVYGVKSANGVPGEKDVVAAIVSSSVTPSFYQSLFQRCRVGLEANFVPSYIQQMKEIPKTASEKPLERLCLESFERHPEAVFTEKHDKF